MYIEFDEALPVYTQIIDGIKRQIFGGQLDAGARIPPVREMAADLGVNPNTLQKALLELERCGLVKARRTAGRYVTINEQEIIRQRQEMMVRIVTRFVGEMGELGCSFDEIMAVIEQAYTPAEYQPAYTTPDYDSAPVYGGAPLANADLSEQDSYTGAGPYVPAPAVAAEAYMPPDQGYSPASDGFIENYDELIVDYQGEDPAADFPD